MAGRLGKLEYRHDPRTLLLGPLLAPPLTIAIPLQFDWDKGRKAFPSSAWGNNDWGLCVKGGQTNQTLRLERTERRRTVAITTADVIEEYKRECQREFGAQPASAGDPNDNGLYVLESIKNWRTTGWPVKVTIASKKPITQKIAAFGELQKNDRQQLRAAIFLLTGIQLGLSLPRTASAQYHAGQAWSVVPGDAHETQPGSWGGHLVFVKRYDQGGLYCITWGKEVYMTNAFVEKYCDEAWGVVDALDGLTSKYLDVAGMLQHLKDVGAHIG